MSPLSPSSAPSTLPTPGSPQSGSPLQQCNPLAGSCHGSLPLPQPSLLPTVPSLGSSPQRPYHTPCPLGVSSPAPTFRLAPGPPILRSLLHLNTSIPPHFPCFFNFSFLFGFFLRHASLTFGQFHPAHLIAFAPTPLPSVSSFPVSTARRMFFSLPSVPALLVPCALSSPQPTSWAWFDLGPYNRYNR